MYTLDIEAIESSSLSHAYKAWFERKNLPLTSVITVLSKLSSNRDNSVICKVEGHQVVILQAHLKPVNLDYKKLEEYL